MKVPWKWPRRECVHSPPKSLFGAEPIKLPTASRGVVSELLACADLVAQGFNVFRSISPNGPYDLIVTRKKFFVRVEVTTGTVLSDGRLSYPTHERYRNQFDVIAVATANGIVAYFKPDGSAYEFETPGERITGAASTQGEQNIATGDLVSK